MIDKMRQFQDSEALVSIPFDRPRYLQKHTRIHTKCFVKKQSISPGHLEDCLESTNIAQKHITAAYIQVDKRTS